MTTLVQARPSALRAAAGSGTLTVTAAGMVAALAFSEGGYQVTSWGTAAVLVWWAIAVATLAGLVHPRALSRTAAGTALLLVAFALWTLASAGWAADAGAAYEAFVRALFYAGLYTGAALAGSRGGLRAWRDGVALGVAAVGIAALASRLFPLTFGPVAGASIMPAVETRLSYPVG